MPNQFLTPTNKDKIKTEVEQDICLFAEANFRNQMRRFGIKLDDRRRHMYVVGKTGMGKTTMMENMVLHDIYSGHGVGIVDPHGDYAEKIINYIPPKRINDVVYFNPADTDFPVGFNILEVKNDEQKHLVVAGLMGVFKKIWPDVWSPRMEYILNNTLLALLDYPGSTLLGINRMLSDKKYRKKVVNKLRDPVVKAFWEVEFASYSEKYATEAVASVQNKIGQFLSANVIRNMVAQVKSTIDVRSIMDDKKIFIMNLSKGRIGEDNSRLLGGMIITKIQLSAMERVDTPENDRQDFFLYVDEFQNFATPSFANILSEARKYRLSLIMAHQYVAQLDEVVADAVFGNVGTIVAFRVGGADAELLAKEFTPVFLEEDVVNLAKYQIFLKLMINGVASQPFSAQTMPPIGQPTGSAEKVIRVSRERYGVKREVIEEKILRWSGMGALSDDEDEGSEEGDINKGTKIDKEDKPDDAPKTFEKEYSKVPVDVPEKTISLSTLLPKGEKKMEPVHEILSEKTKIEPINQVQNIVQPSQSGIPGIPGQGKKRKRKKKKKSNGLPQIGLDTSKDLNGQNQQIVRQQSSVSPQITQIPTINTELKQNTSTQPKTIKPDEIVKFNNNSVVLPPVINVDENLQTEPEPGKKKADDDEEDYWAGLEK